MEVFPPILQLAPGEKRNIRVGGTLRSEAVERTYRLIVEELPAPRPLSERALEIPTLTRLSLPIFFEPAERVVKATVAQPRMSDGRLSFALENAGTVHLRPRPVHVRAADASGATVVEQRWNGWYLLAGGVRHYQLSVAPVDCARIATVSIDAPDDEASIATSWRPPAGSCGRR
jgi:fimbrial chaperone protein